MLQSRVKQKMHLRSATRRDPGGIWGSTKGFTLSLIKVKEMLAADAKYFSGTPVHKSTQLCALAHLGSSKYFLVAYKSLSSFNSMLSFLKHQFMHGFSEPRTKKNLLFHRYNYVSS